MKTLTSVAGPVGLVICFSILISCGSQPKEQVVESEEAVVEEVVEVAEAAAPEALMIVMHQVEDYAQWKSAFDEQSP